MARNRGMEKIMQRAAMTLEAVRSEQELLDGEPVDLFIYSIFSNSARRAGVRSNGSVV